MKQRLAAAAVKRSFFEGYLTSVEQINAKRVNKGPTNNHHYTDQN